MLDLKQPKAIFEPFRIKSVEPIPILSAKERSAILKKNDYNLFSIPAKDVTFDFLTDSGTSAMSSEQWAALMRGDESYAGSKSYYAFAEVVEDLTGMKYIVPTHQGRSAEALLMNAMIKKGDTVLGNTHFDTTRANIEVAGARAIDLPTEENSNSALDFPFKGNMDIDSLKEALETDKNITLTIMTVTNNSVGGQPVSMENIKQTREILKSYDIPLFIDAARFAENAYFIKQREKGFEDRSIKSIAQEMFSYADGVLMSSKKDAFSNIGGFLALNSEEIFNQVRSLMVVTEGFPTYGGLAGRDMEALAVGLQEILSEDYLRYRIASTSYLGKGISEAGFHIVQPLGGHAVYIDAAKTLPHIPISQFPGQSLSAALYEGIGLRSVEIGSVMLGYKDQKTGVEHAAPHEFVRLAIPRRVYTQSHVDYILELFNELKPHLEKLKGYEFTYQAPVLRHFTAKFKQVTN